MGLRRMADQRRGSEADGGVSLRLIGGGSVTSSFGVERDEVQRDERFSGQRRE